MTVKIAHIVAVPNSRLVEIYNELADRPIKKFSDSAAAQRRTSRLLEESDMVLVTGDQAGEYWIEPRTEFESRQQAPRNASKVNTRATHNKNAPIEVLVGQNPKRKGSKSHARFQILIDNPGITVAEYQARVAEMEPAHARKALADLHWDERHQYITVWTVDLLASGDYDISTFSEEYQAEVREARGE